MFQYLVQRQALSEAEARWCFQQLIIAIDYCHRVVCSYNLMSCQHSNNARCSTIAASDACLTHCHSSPGGLVLGFLAARCWSLLVSMLAHLCFSLMHSMVSSVSESMLSMQGVANRDIKLENTLLLQGSPPVIKLCDFGYSKVCSYARLAAPA